MEKANETECQLSELLPLNDLQQRLKTIFPSLPSLEWEIREHRDEYVTGRALFRIGRRLMAHPDAFQRVALAIAARKVARGRPRP
jgi:hypothetical protein